MSFKTFFDRASKRKALSLKRRSTLKKANRITSFERISNKASNQTLNRASIERNIEKSLKCLSNKNKSSSNHNALMKQSIENLKNEKHRSTKKSRSIRIRKTKYNLVSTFKSKLDSKHQIESNKVKSIFQCCNLSRNQFNLILIIQFCIFLLIGHVHCQQPAFPSNQFNRNGAVRNWRVEELLPLNYNNQQPPMINQSIAIQVDVTVKIKNIRFQTKHDKSTSLFVDLDLVEQWKDDRLLIPAAIQLNPSSKLTLDHRYKQVFWTPMLHLANSKHVNLNSFFEPIVYLEINNRKQVFLYAKLELELDCSNQLIKHHHGDNRLEQFGKTIGLFPFDRKECVIELISLFDTLDIISLRWSNFELPIKQTNEFTIENTRSEHCVTMVNSGSYSCLRIRFSLKRKFLSTFINYMLPICIFVLIAYLTFWIPSKSMNGHLIQARMLLLLYSLTAFYWRMIEQDNQPLLLINQNSASSSTASFTIWYFVNLIFILIAIIEFILQLNQSAVRRFILNKIVKDANFHHSENYGATSANGQSTLVNATTKVQLNNTINSQDTASNQSIDRDSLKQIKNKKKNISPIYLKMLGLSEPNTSTLNNNRHQSSSHINMEQQESKDWNNVKQQNDFNQEWLDNLFCVFYPLFYIAFLFLFLFISLIG